MRGGPLGRKDRRVNHPPLPSRCFYAAEIFVGQVQPMELVDERRAAQLQQPRRLTLVAAGLLEAPQNQLAFELRDHRR